MTYDLA